MSDGIDEIVVVPGAFLDAMADGDFGSIGGLKDVSGEAIEKGLCWREHYPCGHG
ncbi:hypothetical protein [Mesorhizobium sp. M0909]|uniref:hypothetical protein n=1 Tax=Mesorhizobium sp. M0909 TaxID=2957024 RepID=UPI003339F0BF